jgi:hypothetical protein
MTPKSKSKLLKIVLKRAELMRAPFRDPSWKSQINQTNTKPSFTNKVGRKFRSKLAKLSMGKTWTEIQKVCIIKKILYLRIVLTND